MSRSAHNKAKANFHQRPSIAMKVVILGDGGVGKSCVMNRFVANKFDTSTFHTIGVEFLNREIDVKGESFMLQIWDTAGQERFKSLRTPFYRGSDICMLCFSVDDRRSFDNLTMWKKEFLYYADVKDPSTFPLIVLGNKCDIDPLERAVSQLEGEAWCKLNGDLIYVETSAKDAINVDYAFSLAVDNWRKMEANACRGNICDTIDLNKNNESKIKCC